MSHGVADVHRVMRLLPELYRSRPVSALLSDTVRPLGALIPNDGCGWFVYALDGRPRLEAYAESQPVLSTRTLSRVADVAPHPPFIGLWSQRQSLFPAMYSDVSTPALRWFVDKYYGTDMSREVGADALTIPVSVTPARACVVSFRRDRGRFREEDGAVAALLSPHLAQAFANAEEVSRLLDGGPGRLSMTEQLTERELQVAFWLARGKTNVEIGLILAAKPRTVEKHVERILRKLRVENRTAAALLLLSTPHVRGVTETPVEH
jgi:DNA-binding CsgD family transcriptional regulator